MIELSGSGNFAEATPRVSVIGSAVVENFTYKTAPFLKVAVRIFPGTANAECCATCACGTSPASSRPISSKRRTTFASILKAPSIPLSCAGSFHRKWAGSSASGNGASLHQCGSLSAAPVALQRLDRGRHRGAPAHPLPRRVDEQRKRECPPGKGRAHLHEFRVTRDEGVATGAFTYDFAKHEVRLNDQKLAAAGRSDFLDRAELKGDTPYKFRQAPNVTANGVYQFHGGKNTRLEITVDAPGGMDYVFLGKTLPFDRISSKLLFTNDRLQLIDLTGSLFSGPSAARRTFRWREVILIIGPRSRSNGDRLSAANQSVLAIQIGPGPIERHLRFQGTRQQRPQP